MREHSFRVDPVKEKQSSSMMGSNSFMFCIKIIVTSEHSDINGIVPFLFLLMLNLESHKICKLCEPRSDFLQ